MSALSESLLSLRVGLVKLNSTKNQNSCDLLDMLLYAPLNRYGNVGTLLKFMKFLSTDTWMSLQARCALIYKHPHAPIPSKQLKLYMCGWFD